MLFLLRRVLDCAYYRVDVRPVSTVRANNRPLLSLRRDTVADRQSARPNCKSAKFQIVQSSITRFCASKTSRPNVTNIISCFLGKLRINEDGGSSANLANVGRGVGELTIPRSFNIQVILYRAASGAGFSKFGVRSRKSRKRCEIESNVILSVYLLNPTMRTMIVEIMTPLPLQSPSLGKM